ncbi:hypothetical protein L6164_019314 [Bauhinia variegata]|uniref:Uncharacterized protein n=1 Tax=Bauhinia variegata TaxID=167791 RepID=A0ACB9MSN1_BAUVA|nr:hypothetical protein L6164_019314 [Bauhinia variegata]
MHESPFSIMAKTRLVVTLSGRVINGAVSFVTFSVLDLVDFILCFIFKLVDLLIEGEWKPCYCSNYSAKEAITSNGKILVSEKGESKIVSVSSSSSKLQLEDISDTLYSRPCLVSELNNINSNTSGSGGSGRSTRVCSTSNSTIVEMLQGKIRRQEYSHRWSDCDCQLCTYWISCSSSTSTTTTAEGTSSSSLFVRSQGATFSKENVIFIHGFISSSLFWTETLFPNFSRETNCGYRLFAVDLLGFGRSPKPSESMYTLREHIEMIERSVLEPHELKSFHIVAHSLGCILALALAVKHPHSVKSLTLLAPPFYPVPKGTPRPTQYVMSKVAPRRVWPPMALGASIACWYEHITRMVCLLICKNHRLWEFLTKLLTRNRVRTFLLEGFFCHTHNAAWHTLHNIICGTAGKMESYLDVVRENVKCKVTVFHGKDDEVIPVDCSYEVQKRIPRAKVRVIEKKDHITIVVGRQKAFARELEQIWSNCNSNS